MSNTIVELYRQRLFTLSKTLLFKQLESAQAINQNLINNGYSVDEYRPETWKYFLNLAGEYHQYDKDLLSSTGGYMIITIAGPTGPVETAFTKELIQGDSVDSGTANEYAFGSRRYQELVGRYPELELLILGILNPIDKELALSAPNHTILYCGGYFAKKYDRSDDEQLYTYHLGDRYTSETALIEEQEFNLISELQKFINLSFTAYNTKEYAYIDDLYIPILIMRTMALVPGYIETIRRRNIKTRMVHTFYIREYLESRGYLGRYVKDIPLEQALYLYRNAEYLRANRGRQSTFDDIVENMLTPTNIPISGFNLRQDTSLMGENELADLYVEREVINIKQVGAGTNRRTLRELLESEVEVARSNEITIDEDEKHITDEFVMGSRGLLNTKVLESVVIDYTNPTPFDLTTVMLNQWAFTASRGLYTGSIYIPHPFTGDRIQLTPLNAYILMLYCLYKGYNHALPPTIPDVKVFWIPISDKLTPPTSQHLKYPTMNDVKKMVDKRTTESMLNHLFINREVRFTQNSVFGFKNETKLIYNDLTERYFKICRVEDYISRGDMEYVMRRFYWDSVNCKLVNNNYTFDNWLLLQGIDLSMLDNDTLVELAISIAEAATGADTNSAERLQRLQTAMINILKYHSSYTVQFLKSITLKAPSVSNAKVVRMAELNIHSYANWKYNLGRMFFNYHVTSAGNWQINLHDSKEELARTIVIKQIRKIPVHLGGIGFNIKTTDIGLRFNMSKANHFSISVNYSADNNDYVPLDL